jgi:hypothetical protein
MAGDGSFLRRLDHLDLMLSVIEPLVEHQGTPHVAQAVPYGVAGLGLCAGSRRSVFEVRPLGIPTINRNVRS